MSYPVYSEMKASGVEWLDAIPDYWTFTRLKFVKRGAFTYGANEAAELDDPNLPRFIRITDLKDDGTLREDTFRSLSEETAASYILEDGDFLFARSGATVGKAFMYSQRWGRACFAGYLIRMRPDHRKVLPTFLKYFVKSKRYEDAVKEVSIQATIQNVSAEKYANFWMPLPPIPEQQQIAAFLDRKTAELDAVIRLKERQLELLAEKRQALISQAVTRGLDPNVPLKPSGIPWLGDVPEHWAIIPVWMLFNLGRGRVISNLEILDNPGSYPVYSSQTENNGVMGYLDTYDFEGTYLTWTTDGAKAGTVFYREGKFNCTNVCGTLKAKRIGIEPKYFQFALSLATPGYVRYDINPKLMNDEMAHILIPKPSLEEQQSIVAYLDTETARMEGVGAAIKTQIETLREYRQALVSAAVTGKIDVRGEP
jgi:type I restriction enzyme S subunit